MKCDDLIAEITRRQSDEVARWREEFAAAYATRTDIDPRDAVQTERRMTNGDIRIWYTHKKDIRGQEDVDALRADNELLRGEVERLKERLKEGGSDE